MMAMNKCDAEVVLSKEPKEFYNSDRELPVADVGIAVCSMENRGAAAAAAAATSACNTVDWTYTTQLKYGTLPFKYFQGYNQFFRVPCSAEIIIYSPNAVVIFQLMLSLADVKCTPVSRGGRRGASRLSPAKRAKGGAFWYSYVL
jgi:hypothetical protein